MAPDQVPDSATGTARPVRLSRALAPRATRTQVAVGLLFVLLGFLVVAAVRGNDEETFLDVTRSEDLVRVLDDLSARQARLEAEARRLEVSRDRLLEGNSGQALEEIQRRADGLAILAGTVPATGPGIVVTFRDPDASAVDGSLLLDAVQELRDAGAEAMQIGDVRVVVSTWFGDERGRVVVDGQPVESPYVLRAIGDPDTMATALEIPGGVADTVRTAGGSTWLPRTRWTSPRSPRPSPPDVGTDRPATAGASVGCPRPDAMT
jgi:uncharacterized protein YlxW (UPF0749 family)